MSRNIAASIRQKLLNFTTKTGDDPNLIWSRYAVERLLYRLSVSEFSGEFVLKGAALFIIWSKEIYRPTMDLDLLGYGEPSSARMENVFRRLCKIDVVNDGLEFDEKSVRVVEGEVELADRNRLLGKLSITGSQVRRDVPAGSEVEVTIHMDSSRIIRAKAYIPMLDEEYEAVIDYNRFDPNPTRLKKEFDDEIKRIKVLREKAGDANDKEAEDMLERIDNADEVEVIERLLDAADGDPDAANKAEKRLLEMKVTLDRAENALKWPALLAEAHTALDDLEGLVAQHAPQHKPRLDQLRQQINDLIEQKRYDALRKMMDKVRDLHREILFEQPGFWVGFFNLLVKDIAKMNDQVTADRLCNQGQQCIQKGNVSGLRNVVAQLLDLLPKAEAEAIQRGYQSGLIK